MGRILGISTAYYWQIENRRRRLFYIEAIRIAHIFHLKPDDLFYKND